MTAVAERNPHGSFYNGHWVQPGWLLPDSDITDIHRVMRRLVKPMYVAQIEDYLGRIHRHGTEQYWERSAAGMIRFGIRVPKWWSENCEINEFFDFDEAELTGGDLVWCKRLRKRLRMLWKAMKVRLMYLAAGLPNAREQERQWNRRYGIPNRKTCATPPAPDLDVFSAVVEKRSRTAARRLAAQYAERLTPAQRKSFLRRYDSAKRGKLVLLIG